MPSATSDMKALHHLLLELEEVEGKITRGPRRIAASRRRAEEREAELETKKAALLQLRKTGDEKTLQLKTNEAKILDLRAKLNLASTNREFDLIKGQIEADEMANSVLEDEILEVFEKVDAAEQEIAAFDETCKEARADEKRVADQVAAAAEGLQSEADGLKSSIKEAEGILPDAVMERYRRLISAHGAGAMAMVEDSVCNACYVNLEPQMFVEVKAGKFVFCKHCGRLLYLADSED